VVISLCFVRKVAEYGDNSERHVQHLADISSTPLPLVSGKQYCETNRLIFLYSMCVTSYKLQIHDSKMINGNVATVSTLCSSSVGFAVTVQKSKRTHMNKSK
jgi:hypothetical protein